MGRRVIIVGAGIVGASLAWHLSRSGADVTVFDASCPGAGASGASDGAVSIATKSPGPLMDLAIAAKAYYRELSVPSGPLSGAYKERSTYLVAQHPDEFEILARQAEELGAAGVPVHELTGTQLRKTLPALRDDVEFVLEVREEGHALGYQIVQRLLAASGATVHRGASVERLALGDAGCTGVVCNGNVFEADDVVVTAGIGSSNLICGVGILPQRGQLIVTDRSPLSKKFPGSLFFAAYLVAKSRLRASTDSLSSVAAACALVIDPLETGQFLIGSTREPDGNAQYTSFAAVSRILRNAVHFVPGLADLNVVRVFSGVRACVSDGIPLVGQVPEAPGLWIATGFAGDGICLAPLVGRELARSMCSEDAIAEMAALEPSRVKDLRAVA